MARPVFLAGPPSPVHLHWTGREWKKSDFMKEKPYRKHIYWLTREEKNRLGQRLAAQHIKLKKAKGIVCAPLDALNKITSVAPEVWSETCGRQGSWYRTSEKNGLYLIVSSFDLKDYR